MWIVELDKGCWLAPWGGDPGRTLVRESAKKYRSEHAANCAMLRAKRVFRPGGFAHAKSVFVSVEQR